MTFKLPLAPARKDQPEQGRFNMEVAQVLKKLLVDVPWLNGHLLVDVAVGVADTQVNHLLGRVPRGMIVTSQDTNAVIWQDLAPTSTVLHLQASAAVTADIWVF